MSSFGFRPHFSYLLPGAPAEEQQRLFDALCAAGGSFEVKSFPGFLCLRIPPSDRHFWSPRLHLSFEAGEAGKTCLEGIYGPNANVWSLFLYGYLLVGSAALFGGSFGWAQHALGKTPWGLWIFWAALAIAAGLYVLAQFGQKIGSQQTYRLHQLFEAALGDRIEVR
ncbi:hypothetical protein [Haloferula sargassicola]|uniref:hypothetical protein n=1 Tax=Haloferula sargassicola TaxID=490096 RepID=UPI00336561D6